MMKKLLIIFTLILSFNALATPHSYVGFVLPKNEAPIITWVGNHPNLEECQNAIKRSAKFYTGNDTMGFSKVEIKLDKENNIYMETTSKRDRTKGYSMCEPTR